MKIDNFTLAFIYFTIASIVLGGVSALGSFIIYTIKFEVFPLKKKTASSTFTSISFNVL